MSIQHSFGVGWWGPEIFHNTGLLILILLEIAICTTNQLYVRGCWLHRVLVKVEYITFSSRRIFSVLRSWIRNWLAYRWEPRGMKILSRVRRMQSGSGFPVWKLSSQGRSFRNSFYQRTPDVPLKSHVSYHSGRYVLKITADNEVIFRICSTKPGKTYF